MSAAPKNRRQSLRWSPWLLAATVVTLLLIWGQSVLPVSGSAKESGWLLQTVVNPVLRFLGFADMRQTLLRKLAHVSEFTLFTFCLTLLLRGREGLRRRHLAGDHRERHQPGYAGHRLHRRGIGREHPAFFRPECGSAGHLDRFCGCGFGDAAGDAALASHP